MANTGADVKTTNAALDELNEYADFIEPMCYRQGGVCHEFKSCGLYKNYKK